jgi:hypothetical protein
VSDALGWQVLEPEYAKLYADAYTEEELDGIVAFYKSPSWQAMVKKSPELMRQSGAMAQEHLLAIAPQIQQLMKEFITEAASRAKNQQN